MQCVTLRATREKRKEITGKRTDAFIVTPAQGVPYADILGEFRRNADPVETGTEIEILRKTRSKNTMLELMVPEFFHNNVWNTNY